MDPREIREQIVSAVEEDITLVASGYAVASISDCFERLSSSFQALGLCFLLEYGTHESYRENLIRSGHARRFYLAKLAQAGVRDDRRLALSRTEAFFDAVAAGHHRLGAEIAELSRAPWNPDWEYQDDYHYFQFLHRFIARPQPDDSVFEENLQGLRAAVEGEEDFRVSLLESLRAADEVAFLSNLILLMNQRKRRNETRKDLLLEADLDALVHWPRMFVSVEGLALLSLARAAGLRISANIPLCPPVAQLPVTNQDCEDFFRGIEAELQASGT